MLQPKRSGGGFNWFHRSSYSKLPSWRRGRGLDCGSGYPGLISSIPSLCVGPRTTRRLKMSLDVPVPFIRVGLACKRPLAAHGVGVSSRSKFGNRAAVVEWLSSWLAEQEVWGPIPHPAT